MNVLSKEVNGAILMEDFAGPEIDTSVWREWVQDAALNLEQRAGTFAISGTSGKPVYPEFVGFRFTGLVSQKRHSRDAVLITRMRVPRGISNVPGMERYIVHLCGSVPDYFLEVVYGKDEEGRRGWFQYRLSHEGFFFDSAPVLEGECAEEFREIKIEYSHVANSAQGFLLTSAGWEPVGDPVKLFMSSMKVELKVNCPTDSVPILAEFKDCRLYPRPSTAPVEFIAFRLPAPLYLCPDLRIRLLEYGSRKLIGETVTDRWATGRIELPDTLTFPLACWIEVLQGEKKLGEQAVRTSGVDGLYPGDLWAVRVPEETPTP